MGQPRLSQFSILLIRHGGIPQLRLFCLVFWTICIGTSSALATEQEHALRGWKKLLHFGATRSRVVSPAFFLSAQGQSDYRAELTKTIEILNTAAGQNVACEFPARYLWLRKTQKNIPAFDLTRCKALTTFIRGFQKQTVSVSFASEYLNHPVSSFGHTMLVFHDRDKPLLSADAVHFAAKTDSGDNFARYVWKGITGGYPGYFLRDPFFKKQYQYNIVEQRYIHLYTLDFTGEQIRRLLYHLYELRKATFNYYFINENCAYQIGALLDIASDDNHFSDSKFILPIEVITAHRHKIIDKTVLYPSAIIVQHLLRGMSKTEQLQFEAVVNGRRPPDNFLSNRVKYALATYYEYRFKQQNSAGPYYQQVTQLNYTKPMLAIQAPEPLDRPDFSRISAGYIKEDHGEGMRLSYRPFLLDLFDIQANYQSATELSLFNIVMHSNGQTTSLEQLDLINIKSLPPRSAYFKPLSWNFYTGFNRNNPAKVLDYETEFGIGLTNNLAVFTLNYALNVGIDFSSGDYFYKPNATLLTNLGKYLKIGLTASEKYYDQHQYIERNAFATLGLGSYAVNARYTTSSSPEEDMVILSIYKYFD